MRGGNGGKLLSMLTPTLVVKKKKVLHVRPNNGIHRDAGIDDTAKCCC